MTTTATKTSKLDSLKADLVLAEARLAEARARLQPQIAAAQEAVDQLRRTMDRTRKASDKAYQAYQAVSRAVAARLFPAETAKALREAIKAKVAAQFPNADIERLAREYEVKKVQADAECVAAVQAHRAAYAASEAAGRAWNVATNPGGKLAKLRYELEKFEDVVSNLKKEIERLPRYRDAQKERRAKEKREAQVEADTKAAREALADFTF